MAKIDVFEHKFIRKVMCTETPTLYTDCIALELQKEGNLLRTSLSLYILELFFGAFILTQRFASTEQVIDTVMELNRAVVHSCCFVRLCDQHQKILLI